MQSDQSVIQKCHQLLNDVLQDAFNIPSLLFMPPYEDFKKIDRGMRAAVWTNYDVQDPAQFFAESSPRYRIIIVKSNLGFYNIMITLGKEAPPKFISVGPYRDNELSANYFAQILKDAHISPKEIRDIKHMYEKMPLAQTDAVVNVIRHILEHFLPDFSSIVPEYMQFTEQKHMTAINNELLNMYSVDYAEQYKKLLFTFLEQIINGNNTAAKEALHTFLQETTVINNKNMLEYKTALQRVNEQCQLALFHTSVHPLHILKQAASIHTRIKEETSFSGLEKLPNEICRKYCLLVKNYTNPECSRMTKDVISYIQLHLDEELTLRILADHFHKNASALSTAFSKDMGVSLTTYIQQTRIQASLKLFNTTTMSISEVATAVGYQDFSYFSKLFSRYTGQSPRAYLSKKS